MAVRKSVARNDITRVLNQTLPGRVYAKVIPKHYLFNNKKGCGNWKIEGTEDCDDGNQLNGDGCSSDC